MVNKYSLILVFLMSLVASACQKEENTMTDEDQLIQSYFGSNISLNKFDNYANQTVPSYIAKNNTFNGNNINDFGATLGRVLFYDKNLSSNNTVSCASCHIQSAAFGDTLVQSNGANGTTPRHSMRIVNASFGADFHFFWDERAFSAENQATFPTKSHNEMGFSGVNGDPSFNDLLVKLAQLPYYKILFKMVYGDTTVTEPRMQNALAQFVRSIQSFDAKYDMGRSQVSTDLEPFPNFTPLENQGKHLFLTASVFDANGIRIGGGLGCNECHNAPEFDIVPNSKNNGLISMIEGNAQDLSIVRSPSLRDIFNTNGLLNAPLMHTGLVNFNLVLDHYNQIESINSNIDSRLMPNGMPQNLALTQAERDAVTAFMKTLSGKDIYTNKKWSDPFVN
ncbi:MAG: cytochrome-c peroxidase [Chitinophagales bacterium]